MKSKFAVIIENKTDDFDVKANAINGYRIVGVRIYGTAENIISIIEYRDNFSRCIRNFHDIVKFNSENLCKDEVCWICGDGYYATRFIKDQDHQIRAIEYLGKLAAGFQLDQDYRDAWAKYRGIEKI